MLLDNPEKVWVVQTGSVTLFATKIKDGSPSSNHRYISSVGAGSALFGAARVSNSMPAEQDGILAVATESTELSLISIADLVGQVADGSAVAIAQVEGCILHCLKYETQIGWLIDPEERSVFVYLPERPTDVFDEPEACLPMLEFAKDFSLTLGDLFGWLLE